MGKLGFEELVAAAAKGELETPQAESEQPQVEQQGELGAAREAVTAELAQTEVEAGAAGEAITETEAAIAEVSDVGPEDAAELDAIKGEVAEVEQRHEDLKAEAAQVDGALEGGGETVEASESLGKIIDTIEGMLDDPAVDVPHQVRERVTSKLRSFKRGPDLDWSRGLSSWDSATESGNFISAVGREARQNIYDKSPSTAGFDRMVALSSVEDAKRLSWTKNEAYNERLLRRTESERPPAAKVLDEILDQIPAGRERKIYEAKLKRLNLDDAHVKEADEATAKRILEQRKQIFEAGGTSVEDFDKEYGGSTEMALRGGMSFGKRLIEGPAGKELVDKYDDWKTKEAVIEDAVKTDMAEDLMQEAGVYKRELQKAEDSEDRRKAIDFVARLEAKIADDVDKYTQAKATELEPAA